MNAQPRRYYGGNSHTSWCCSRCQSYRAWDNSYQPCHGARRACYSPYR
nr:MULTISPECIES: BA14K family protein [unclassified Ensifer]